jgi:hypothetical protein
MRGGLLIALLLATAPLAERARADDVIGDLLEASLQQGTAPPDDTPLEGRRRPGRAPEATAPPVATPLNPNAVAAPPPEAFPRDMVPIPDRWRLIEAVGTHSRWFDPYNQNTLKGDRPIKGTRDWFLTLTGISDTLVEPRSFPIPVSVQTTSRPGSLDTFGRTSSLVASQTFITGLALTKGSTAFKPPEIEARLTLAFNYNYAQVTTSGTSRIVTTSTQSASESSRFPATSEGFFSRTTSWACASSATATTIAGSTISPPSAASRRTPTPA